MSTQQLIVKSRQHCSSQLLSRSSKLKNITKYNYNNLSNRTRLFFQKRYHSSLHSSTTTLTSEEIKPFHEMPGPLIGNIWRYFIIIGFFL